MKKILFLIISLSLIFSNVIAKDFRYTKGSENKIANYGYMDYFSEVGFKNNLINEGYSKVYDFDNPSLDLTLVKYYGKTGNPNSVDTDYVLTSEYEKYSSQYQDIRISQNKDHNDYQDMRLNANKDNILINKKKISNVDDKHTGWNNKQDSKIVNNSNNIANNLTKINNNTNRINDNSNRISELEETQYVIEGSIRVLDTKKWTVKPFTRYNIGRNKIDTVGVKFTFKLGSSFEERKIYELERKLEKLIKKQNHN